MKQIARLIAIVAGVFTVTANASQGEKILKSKLSLKHTGFQEAGHMPQDVASK